MLNKKDNLDIAHDSLWYFNQLYKVDPNFSFWYENAWNSPLKFFMYVIQA